MLVWINGAFGVGKTSLVFEMQALHSAAVIFDPEEIGFALRRTLKPAPTGDFQDIPLWRELVRTSLEHLAFEETCPIFIPMTLVNPVYFHEIIGELRAQGIVIPNWHLSKT